MPSEVPPMKSWPREPNRWAPKYFPRQYLAALTGRRKRSRLITSWPLRSTRRKRMKNSSKRSRVTVCPKRAKLSDLITPRRSRSTWKGRRRTRLKSVCQSRSKSWRTSTFKMTPLRPVWTRCTTNGSLREYCRQSNATRRSLVPAEPASPVHPFFFATPSITKSTESLRRRRCQMKRNISRSCRRKKRAGSAKNSLGNLHKPKRII